MVIVLPAIQQSRGMIFTLNMMAQELLIAYPAMKIKFLGTIILANAQSVTVHRCGML